jgi:hypothetical protein
MPFAQPPRMNHDQQRERLVTGFGNGAHWLLGALVGLCACGSTTPAGRERVAAQKDALGTTNATWHELGPKPQQDSVDSHCFQGLDANGNPVFSSATTGSTRIVIPHPSDPNILYAASGGGVWRTSNAAQFLPDGEQVPPHWQELTDALPSTDVGAFAMDPGDPRALAAGTGTFSLNYGDPFGGHVYVTHDGGDTWNVLTDQALKRHNVVSIALRSSTAGPASDRIVVGTDGSGLFRRVDAAGFASIGGPAGFVQSIATDPANFMRLYAASRDNGLFRSDDDGASWLALPTADGGGSSELRAVTHSGNVTGLHVALGLDGRVFISVIASDLAWVGYSDDRGASFTSVELPKFQTSSGTIVAITGDTTTPIVITGSVGFGGSHVRLSGTGSPELDRDFFADAIKDTNNFKLLDPLTRQPVTVPNGATLVTGGSFIGWVATQNFGQIDKSAATVDPGSSDILYVSGDGTELRWNRPQGAPTNLIPSDEWTSIREAGSNHGTFPHADSLSLAVDTRGGLVLGCDGGVFRYDSPRTIGDWQSLNTDLATSEMHDMAIDPLSGFAFGGLQDNGTVTQQSVAATGWHQLAGGDGGDVLAVLRTGSPVSDRYFGFPGMSVLVHQTFDPSGVAVSGQDGPERCIHRTGTTCDLRLNDDKSPDGGQFVTRTAVNEAAVAADPTAPVRFVVGGSTAVWETSDAGQNFTSLLTGASAQHLAYGHPNDLSALWAVAQNGGVFVRLNGGALHATPASPPLRTIPPEDDFGPKFLAGGVAMSPAAPEQAYVAIKDQVFSTHDGGATWLDVSGDLIPSPRACTSGSSTSRGESIFALEYVPSSRSDRLFVGTEHGVFMAAVDNLGVWTQVGSNLPATVVSDLDYLAPRPDAQGKTDMLVASTYGRGAWSVDNAAELNRAPVLGFTPSTPGAPPGICDVDVRLAADAACQAQVSPQNVGISADDPDGDAVTLGLSSNGPFGAGASCTTFTATDAQGAAAGCNVHVNVVDVTPPTLTPPPDQTLSTCSASASVRVGQATATDNCASPLTPTGQVIVSNGVTLVPPLPVTNGQVTLGPGTHIVRWTVSDGTNTTSANQTVVVSPGIEAAQSFLVDDRAQVQNSGGGFGAILNGGAGATRVGQDARSGGVLSVGAVSVLHRAVVSGNVTSASTVFKDLDATVNGTITQNTPVSLPPLPSLPAFPTPTLGSFTVNSGTTQTHQAGSYTTATVNGGTLVLGAGDYFFQSLTINSGSTVRAQATTRIFVRNTLVFNAPIRAASGTALQSIFLGFAGANLSLTAPFNGTLLAPNAAVTFGTGAGLTYTGSFFGRTLEITPASVLVCRAS